MRQNLRTNLFNEFLNYFWLRPENAIIFTLKGEKLFQTKKFIKNISMDVACGNGIFFLLLFEKSKTKIYLDLDYGKRYL